MVKLNLFDIQGFVARGYNFPRASYLLAEIPDYKAGREFVGRVTEQVTSAERWEQGKTPSTLNIGFTWKGLRKLGLPDATLLSFPDEFYQGMRARNRILGDVGKNDPANWDSVWKEEIHVWLHGGHIQRVQHLRPVNVDVGILFFLLELNFLEVSHESPRRINTFVRMSA